MTTVPGLVQLTSSFMQREFMAVDYNDKRLKIS
jgi:hypothetical protein